MNKDSKIFIAGSETLIGAAIQTGLQRHGYSNIIEPRSAPELTEAEQVDRFFATTAPEYVFMAAGESGGISANQRFPARLMLDNLLVESNVIRAAFDHGTTKLLYLASSCIYPKDCPQPMRESAVLTGALEPTNEAYAVAKIAGMKLCQAYNQQYGADAKTKFITCIPANVFGPGDDFDLEESHVIPSLIRRMHEAKLSGAPQVEIWGSGKPRREFIFSQDLADACITVMNDYDESEPINVGVGSDLSIGELARQIQEVVGYAGELTFNTSRPDGIPAKLLDSSQLMARGWRPTVSLPQALKQTYDWYTSEGPGAEPSPKPVTAQS
ncbi:MAG: GDP-L-fucose synthase [SAR202 cluster bacterium]|nr:GDP-fucose synthetase [Gemmatimonadota bacterium]MQF94405.1 GDP-L-fucose synthase [SAR202 cluster bacterium]|tara:strand:+ start:96 stop:1073 length:978 start_codon:yes stop_codon:yes gene_type:complete